jgi:uncharacterized protein YbjT (DUF2867 family)
MIIQSLKQEHRMKKQIILVTGATGKQGGATARHLLLDGWHVRALVRNPSSDAATALAQAGVEVVPGDLDNPATVESALQNVYGVFSVQRTEFPGQPGFTVEDEIRQGTLLADLAKSFGIKHFVYTSVGGAERDPQIPSWKSKWKIEKYIRALGLPATILRPVAFMENYLSPQFGISTGTLSYFFRPEAITQVIAVDDIGAFASLVFRDPEEYIGQAFELAGDSLAQSQIAAAFGRVLNRQMDYIQIPLEVLTQQQPALAGMIVTANEFAARGGWNANITDLRRRLPGLKSFDQWLAAEGGTELRSLANASPRQSP